MTQPAFAPPGARTAFTADHYPTDLLAAVRAVGQRFREAGFTLEGARAQLGDLITGAVDGEEYAPLLWRLSQLTDDRAADPAVICYGLFVAGRAVSGRLVERALGAGGVDHVATLTRVGVLEASGSMLTARVRISPYDADWYVLSDFPAAVTGQPLAANHVLGVAGASRTLAAFSQGRRVERALDLGCGSGVQSLHASTWAEQVVGTDISARAVAMAQLTAALCDVQATFTVGDLWEPVATQRFDRIVSNPPFVISPRSSTMPVYEYRDAGMRADAVIAAVIDGLPDRLTAGGAAHMLVNWEVRGGQTTAERVSQWFSDNELQYWLVERDSQDPASYARLWLRDGAAHWHHRHDEWMGQWLDDFAARDVERIGFGLLLVAQAEPGKTAIRRCETQRGPIRTAPGDHCLGFDVERALTVGSAWDRADVTQRLDWVLRCTPDLTQETYGRLGEADPEQIFVRQGGGYGQSIRLSSAGAGALGACVGELSVGQICAALAQITGDSPGDVIAEVLSQLDHVVWAGMVDRVHPRGS